MEYRQKALMIQTQIFQEWPKCGAVAELLAAESGMRGGGDEYGDERGVGECDE